MTADKVIDPAVRDAAFKLAANEVSAPVATTFGGALLRVTEIQPERVKPFEEVSAEIKGKIARRAAETQVLDIRDEIEDARAGGATLAEIATRFKLKLVSAEVDAGGNKPDGTAGPDLPEKTKLLQAAFPPRRGRRDRRGPHRRRLRLVLGRQGVPRPRPSARGGQGQGRRGLDRRQGRRTPRRPANDLLAKVKAGTPIADVAREAGLTVATTEAFARSAEKPELGATGVEAAFGGPKDHAAAVEGPDGTAWCCRSRAPSFRPSSRRRRAPEAAKQFRTELEAASRSSMWKSSSSSSASTVNQAMLDAAIGLGSR